MNVSSGDTSVQLTSDRFQTRQGGTPHRGNHDRDNQERRDYQTPGETNAAKAQDDGEGDERHERLAAQSNRKHGQRRAEAPNHQRLQPPATAGPAYRQADSRAATGPKRFAASSVRAQRSGSPDSSSRNRAGPPARTRMTVMVAPSPTSISTHPTGSSFGNVLVLPRGHVKVSRGGRPSRAGPGRRRNQRPLSRSTASRCAHSAI